MKWIEWFKDWRKDYFSEWMSFYVALLKQAVYNSNGSKLHRHSTDTILAMTYDRHGFRRADLERAKQRAYQIVKDGYDMRGTA